MESWDGEYSGVATSKLSADRMYLREDLGEEGCLCTGEDDTEALCQEVLGLLKKRAEAGWVSTRWSRAEWLEVRIERLRMKYSLWGTWWVTFMGFRIGSKCRGE